MEEKKIKELKSFYDIDPNAPYYPTGITLLDEVIGGGLGIGMPGGKPVNLTGDTSSSKCICEGYVLTSKGFERIEDIGRDMPYGATPFNVEVGLGKDEKVKADFFYKEKVNHTIQVATDNANTIEGTPEHKLGIWTFDGVVMKELSEIKEGDILVTAGGTEIYGPPQKMPTVVPSEERLAAKPLTGIPEYLEEGFADYLGCLVADGNITPAHVVISGEGDEDKERLRKYLKSIGLVPRISDKRTTVCSALFSEYVQKIVGPREGFTARYKRVPKIVLQSPKNIQSEFLRSLIDRDGHISTNEAGEARYVEYYTASWRLVNDVHMMLLNMGIRSRIYSTHGAYAKGKYYNHTYYRLAIMGDDFVSYLGVVGTRKPLAGVQKNTCSSVLDRIPHMGAMISYTVDHIREQIGWSANGQNKLGVTIPPLKHKYLKDNKFSLESFLNSYGHLGEYFPEDKPLSFFTDLLEQQYYFDEIVSVENKHEEVDVFDFHVPDGNLFWANGFVNHNTFVSWHMIAANHYYWQSRDIPFKWIYDDTEHGSTLNVTDIYGLENFEDNVIHSSTIEEAHSNINQFLESLEEGEMGIYILDSLDPLKTESDIDAIDKDLEKAAEGKAAARGSYDMAKQKYMSSRFFPQVVPLLGEKNAILIVVSQVRYNVSGMGAKFTIGGGKAADHNFNSRIMFTRQRPIEITSQGEKMEIGAGIKAKLMKNKTPRPGRECQFDLYYTRGIDDIGACLDYLYDLKTPAGLSRSPMLDWDGEKYKKDALVKHIYDNKLVPELRKRTIDLWETRETTAAERAKSKVPEQIWEW